MVGGLVSDRISMATQRDIDMVVRGVQQWFTEASLLSRTRKPQLTKQVFLIIIVYVCSELEVIEVESDHL